MMNSITTLLFVTALVTGSAFCESGQPQSCAPEAEKKVIAVILGKDITADEEEDLSRLIVQPLLEQFVKENKLEPTDDDLDVFVRRSEEIQRERMITLGKDKLRLDEELKSPLLSPKERAAKEAHLKNINFILKSDLEMKKKNLGKEEEHRKGQRAIGQHFVKMWKINQALYAKYKGRVIFQQAGPEPLDAYRDFLKEQEREGAFQIVDKGIAVSFWKYYTDDSMHVFSPKEEAAKMMNTPWWLMKKEEKK